MSCLLTSDSSIRDYLIVYVWNEYERTDINILIHALGYLDIAGYIMCIVWDACMRSVWPRPVSSCIIYLYKPPRDGYFRPTRNVYFPPAHDGYFQPTRDGYFRPAHDGYFRPTRDGYFPPAQDGYSRPADDRCSWLAEDCYSRPVEDGYFRPAEYWYFRPAGDGYFRPAQDEYSRPADDGDSSPAEDWYSRPVKDGYFRPAEDGYSRPAENGYFRPAEVGYSRLFKGMLTEEKLTKMYDILCHVLQDELLNKMAYVSRGEWSTDGIHMQPVWYENVMTMTWESFCNSVLIDEFWLMWRDGGDITKD